MRCLLFCRGTRNKEEPANDRAREGGEWVKEHGAQLTQNGVNIKAAKEKLRVLKIYLKNIVFSTLLALRPHHICFCFQLRSLFSAIFFRLALCSATHSVFDCCCRHRPTYMYELPLRAVLMRFSAMIVRRVCVCTFQSLFFVQHYKIYLLTQEHRQSTLFYTFCFHSHSQLKLSLITACSSYCTQISCVDTHKAHEMHVVVLKYID